MFFFLIMASRLTFAHLNYVSEETCYHHLTQITDTNLFLIAEITELERNNAKTLCSRDDSTRSSFRALDQYNRYNGSDIVYTFP